MEFMDIIKTPQLENVTLKLLGSRKGISGTLCLTSHQLIFFNKINEKDETWVCAKCFAVTITMYLF